MRITVTKQEAQKAIRAHFGLPTEAEIIISRLPEKGYWTGDPQLHPSFPQQAAAAPAEDDRLPYKLRALLRKVDELIGKKELIPAIKLVRTFAGCGLKTGKDIVENWTTVRAQAELKGYLPMPVYDSSVSANISRWT